MRTKFAVRAAVVPAIVALAMLVFGSAIADAHGKKRTLRLVGTEIQSDFLDLGATGPSLGDEFVFSESLSKNGREVGESGGVCTITQVTPPYGVITFHCVATLSLRRGQITLQGLIEVQGENDQGPFTAAITGGTGKFRCACGEARIRDVDERTTIYKLRLDFCDHKHKR
jgi:hypothetical protein